ncbi:uncharacterized protein LOC125515130 isoform X1 [Triticum urartu]|uniref:uncharacterized protein LOC125515130 isoform X1 n=1 Tax=Triticum urartu TaxID=4572 RepID=UPI0020444A2B|nr:uncharacterized protein LOC125515130 isoform X1 [Triticum urartu]XP_048536522.1 uncharacterized protein LOC125515130 isoform X1 [Triticum urartu]
MLASRANMDKANSDFWKVKYDHEAANKAKIAAMNAKKTTRRLKKKKKTTAEDLIKLDDTSNSEVALDSLGQFFNNLIDTDPYQDDTGASQVGEAEQHESRREAGFEDEPAIVLQQTPQKRPNEEVSHSSGDSSQTQFPAFKTAPGGQAKSKKAKEAKSAEDPPVLASDPARPPSPLTDAPEDPPIDNEAKSSGAVF